MITTASSLLRVIALLLAVLVLNSPAAADRLKLHAERVHLDETDLDRNLSWRGGLVLTSPDNDLRFKELSALLISDDGSRLTSVTDTGYWVTMDLVYVPAGHPSAGHLSGVENSKIGSLHGLEGEDLTKKQKRDQDAESLTNLDAESLACLDAKSLARLDAESLAVAFERDHRILCYSKGINAAATKLLELPEFEPPNEESNDGVEALVTLANGDLFAIVEGAEDDSESLAYIQHHGKWKRRSLSYQHDKGFRPTGASRLPNGDVLVIERCYNFEPCSKKRTIVRLRRLKADSIVPGARLEGEEIAVLEDPYIVDNFEGVAARLAQSGEPLSGETLVYLLSDDNGNSGVFDDNGKPIQRTLLLMFALTD